MYRSLLGVHTSTGELCLDEERKIGMLVLRSELDRGFDRFFERAVGEMSRGRSAPTRGVVELDLVETDDAFLISADVPGLNRDQLELSIEDNQLTLAGKRELQTDDDARSHVSERRSYTFSRRFDLPTNAIADQTQAKLVQGVLEVTIPKQPVEPPLKIDIAVS